MFSGALTRTIVAIAVCFATQVSHAQTAPKNTRPTESRPAGTQVVTVVHRINGLKLFRLLARSEAQVGAIANFDEAFNLTDDAHTNIIAGLAMEDGRTIAAWLPEADVEFGPFMFSPRAPMPPAAPQPNPAPPAPKAPRVSTPGFAFRGGMFGSPDLTVVGPDGRQMAAEYIGFDGATGLSILRLSNNNLVVNENQSEDILDAGESVHLFNPEPAASVRGPVPAPGSLYVRMGTTQGTILSVKRAPGGGGVARFKVKSPRLSLANIGGVVTNEGGETVGIVDAVEGFEARVLPTALVRRAAQRVLSQHASVPRPWLGVRGEPVARMNLDQIRRQGWKLEQAASLLAQHRGILLTSIAPGSPAAQASLRAGDVILKVDNEEVANADDFSWYLDQAGPSTSVTFTLARPDSLMEEAISVELSGLLDPAAAFGFPNLAWPSQSLLSQGIEAIALKPMVAARLGANSGLLVVYVDPSTAAFNAGLLPGDVIELINGKPASSEKLVESLPQQPTAIYSIVRKKQKILVTIPTPDKKK
jgi:S1-C subfamily serine protease